MAGPLGFRDMASNVITVTMVFENAKAAKALRVACECLEQCQDLEWRPEIVKATKAMRYAMKHIGVATGDNYRAFGCK